MAVEIVFDETPQVFYVGPASCGIPGTAAGLWEASRRFGTMPFEALAAPAVRYAREGVRVTPEQAYVFTLLEPILCRQPEMAELYAPDGNLLTAGDLFRFPALGDALEAIAQEGPGWLYDSDVTAAPVRLGVRARRADVAGRLRRLRGDRAHARGGALPEPARAHQRAAVVGRRPDRLRARPARARGAPAAARRPGRRWRCSPR